MTHPLIPKDQFLMKLKDILLLFAAIAGVWGFFSGYVGRGVAIEAKINQIETVNNKYIPIIESHEKAIIILQEQNKSIISYLDKIERSLRRNSRE